MPGMVVPRARMAGRRDSSAAALRPLFQVTRTTWVTWLMRPCYEPAAAGDHFRRLRMLLPDRCVDEISRDALLEVLEHTAVSRLLPPADESPSV